MPRYTSDPRGGAGEQAPNAAMLYTSQDYRTDSPKLMGRFAATESFFEGFARNAGVDHFFVHCPSQQTARDFAQRVGLLCAPRQVTSTWIASGNHRALAQVGCLYCPDPTIGRLAFLRRAGDQRGYSLCGVTHTICSESSMDALGQLLTCPVQSWDALICTSRAVKSSVERMLAHYAEYLAGALGATAAAPPLRLPVIPLGIDTDRFDAGERYSELRRRLRSEWGAQQSDVVFLFVGRLSFHAKANPWPMFVSLERVAQATGKRLFLVQAGWFSNDAAREAMEEAARVLCPSVRCVWLDGRKPEVRRDVWHGCDVFTSLSDNVQETFGLTPLEAKAAGLPVVVSDWDGYRDTVVDGEDGFLIPTLAPEPGGGADLALRFEAGLDTYDMYIGQCSLATSVDIAACTRAYLSLVQNEELRLRMGEQARRHAKASFDWRSVVRAYQELWLHLAEVRERGSERAPRTASAPSHPLRADPFDVFASYPSRALSSSMPLYPLEGGEGAVKQALSLFVTSYGGAAKEQLAEPLWSHVRQNPGATVGELVTGPGRAHPRHRVVRALLWLLKVGAVQAGEYARPGG